MNSKKIVVVVGTRPNFIKITQLEKELNQYPKAFELVLIHTGQHFDTKMSAVFFVQLNLREPDYNLEIEAENRQEKTNKMVLEIGNILSQEKPDLVIVVGDVDSTYAGAKAAKQQNIKLAHLESGLRSFDNSMPEETNRIAVDKISDLFFVTEKSGVQNLTNEGVDHKKIHFVGNTMIDTLVYFDEEIRRSPILKKINLSEQQYLLMTTHRPQNVDNKENLELILKLTSSLSQITNVILPLHPRTLKQINAFGLSQYIEHNSRLHILEPLDYFAFQHLILHAQLVITDSGGIQEETTFRKVPCLTIRENTERPSTIEIGTNELLPLNEQLILARVNALLKDKERKSSVPPFWDGKSTQRIVSVLNELL